MSVSGIFSSSLIDTQSVQSQMQQVQQEFQQLGKDLQSGNLSAAQADFVTLQQSGPQTISTSSSQSSNPIAQAFNQLGKDLQSGNVSAAQQDYATIQKDFQSQASSSQATAGHHHHHHASGGSGGSGGNEISQLMGTLGQSLQSGNLTSAQQAYSTLQQEFQQFAQNSGQTQASLQSASPSVSLNA